MRRQILGILGCLLISLGGFTPLAFGVQLAPVQEGELKGARYAIAQPAKWNGKLLLIQHGFRDKSVPLFANIETDEEPNRSLLAEGWMLAASSYRRSGMIVQDAMDDVRNLYQHIVTTHGKPERTLLLGSSMGGAITLRLMEDDAGKFDGAIVLGSGLTAREPDLAELKLSVNQPVIFMCNQSELGQPADYVKRAADSGVKPALWIVERDGHVKFTGAEYIAVIRALDDWVGGKPVDMEKKFALDAKEPSSTAAFDAGGAYGTVRTVDPGFGNLKVSFVDADFNQLGIETNASFILDVSGKVYAIKRAATWSDVPAGNWVGFKAADGFYLFAINRGNASKIAALKPGDRIFIRPQTSSK